MKEGDSEQQIFIRMLRAVRNWSQSDLADAAGLAPSTIHRYESGEITASPEALERLSRAAGISIFLLHRIFLPLVATLRAEISGEGLKPGKGAADLAAGIGSAVGSAAREEALALLASLRSGG